MKKALILLVTLVGGISFGWTQEDIIQPVKKDVKKTNVIENSDNSPVVYPNLIRQASNFMITKPLRDAPINNQLEVDKDEFFANKHRNRVIDHTVEIPDFSKLIDPGNQTKDGVLDNSKGIIRNLPGTSSGSYPPDCNGEVNENYFFETVNVQYQIFNKTGTSLAGPSNLNTIFNSGLTGASCNNGDPIVLWDEQAQRWFFAEFALCIADERMLIAVSQTADPTGSWYSWSFNVDDTPDYMKFGIWQDGYYMATNTAGGNDVYVFERSVMLTGGASPQMIAFANPNRPSTFDGFHCILPCDNDGDWAPAGTPAQFITIADNGQSNPADALYIYELDVNWTTPASSTFARTQVLNVNSFSGVFDALDWMNVPQPGTSQQLDGISTVLMYRAQYRNYGTYQSIVCNHTIAEGGTEAAIRWYELRNTGSGWSIYQQGTWNPGGADGISRWNAGIAKNGIGQIGLIYSVSASSGTYPGIRYTGQTTCAPLNTMDISETTIWTGTASQTGAERWGDYTALSVDPSDDLTFWNATEYVISAPGTKGTRITAFTIDESCSPPTLSNVTPASLYEDRGKQITITGSDLLGCTFTIGGISGSIVSNNGTTAVINFPAGNYSNQTLTVTNGSGSDTWTMTVSIRNTIPVVVGAGVTSDNHPTIESAVDGLYAWYGATAFNAGELPGTKTIDVDAGTYTEGGSLTVGLNPTAANPLVIQNQTNEIVIINATGDSYGFDLSTVDYVQLKGFTVYGASLANINILGDNNTIEYNKCYSSVSGSGLKLGAGNNNQINNNLIYSNIYGIHIQTSTNSIIKNNTTYDNGGLLPGVSTTIHSQGFNTASVPTGWSTEVLNDPGTNPTITFVTSGTRPTISTIPEGVRFIEFNSYNCPEAASIRIKQTTSFSTTGYTNIQVNFTWYEDTQYPTDPDGVTIQWSTNGSTWNDATTYSRVGSTNGWFDKVCTLPVGAENQANLYISLKFTSSYGNNCHLDNLIVKGTPSTNSGAAIYVESGTGSSIRNNIFIAKSGNNNYYALQTAAGVTVSSEYNIYYTTNTNLFNYNGTIGNTGPIGTGDITTDPQFVNAPTDFHIKSQGGSYAGGTWPPTVASGGTWTNDATTSPAVDAGDPGDAYGNEPENNGDRINQGAYGNTFQASKTYAVSCSYPTLQASIFGATPSTNSIDLTWTRGNGNAVLVVAREGSAVNANPADGVNYADDAAFGSGDEIGTGNFVVYDGASTSINVTGLLSSTTYYFAIYEYNATGYCYLIPALTGNASTTAPLTFTWTGATSSNWQTTTNWSSGVIPGSSDNVTVPLGCSNYPVINNGIGTPALCNNLTISGGSVTIAPGGYMTVSGSITNSVGVAGLVIQSTDAGTGSLIQNSSTDVNATVQCRLSSTTRQWHMVSSPITAAAFTVFPSQNNLYYYNEATNDFWTGTVYDAGSVSGWTAPAGNMLVGRGYSFNFFASTLNYTGTLNNSNSSGAISVPYTNHGVTADNGANYDNFDGWNLIGNPYTSAIDWDDLSVLHGAANLLDAVYTYDDKTLHNYTSYVGGTGTNGGTRYIPAMQGFFVKGAATELGGTLNIGANARVHNAQSYWKGYTETPENFLRLEVNGNGYKDETVVRMLVGATEDLDNGMDAYKFFTMHDQVPQIYSRTNSDVDYSINSIAVLEEGNVTVPIRLMQTGENYSIKVSEFNFADIKVYFKDNYTSKTTEIGLEDVIELTANESDATDRFEIVFEKAGSSSVVIADQVKAVIYPNPNSGSFYVTVTNGTNGYEMEISNITGQLIYKNKFNDNYTKEIKLNVPNAGVYFVKFRFNDNSTLNKKIIIND